MTLQENLDSLEQSKSMQKQLAQNKFKLAMKRYILSTACSMLDEKDLDLTKSA